ncbi:MAG: ubiquitin-like domain-containing protein [Candidatus Helarchaeota archaeon]
MEDFDNDLDMDFDDEAPIVSKTPKGPAANAKKPHEAELGDPLNIYFKTTVGPGEKTQKLVVNEKAPISEVKYTCGQIFSLDPQDFHFSAGGITMEETKNFADYGVKNDETILLIPTSTAGGF